MPFILTQALPFLGAGSLALLAYWFGQRMARMTGRTGRRVEEIAGLEQKIAEAAFGSEEHRLRLAFKKFGLNAAGKEKFFLQSARVLVGLAVFLILYGVVGFPLVTSLIGFVGGILVINAIVDGAWSSVKQDMEKEIPIFLSGFSSTVQVTQSILPAVEEEAQSLQAGGPLQSWLLTRFVAPCQSKGQENLNTVIEEAFSLSSSLGIAIFLIGRMWATGGKEWEKAFGMASINLEGVLDARVLGQAAGTSAKSSVKMIAGITAFVIVLMVRNPALSNAVNTPLVQIAYAVIVLVMIFGWGFMNNLIDNVF